MIGHAYPYKDTGWSIIEQGKIAANLKLVIERFLITDRHGKTVHQESTREEAEQWLDSYFENIIK